MTATRHPAPAGRSSTPGRGSHTARLRSRARPARQLRPSASGRGRRNTHRPRPGFVARSGAAGGRRSAPPVLGQEVEQAQPARQLPQGQCDGLDHPPPARRVRGHLNNRAPPRHNLCGPASPSADVVSGDEPASTADFKRRLLTRGDAGAVCCQTNGNRWTEAFRAAGYHPVRGLPAVPFSRRCVPCDRLT